MQIAKTLTAEEFNQFIDLPENANRDFELINGEIIEMPSGSPTHNWIAFKIAALIAMYLMNNTVGEALGDNNDLNLDANTVLRPDALYFSKMRMPTLPQKFTIAPDIAIEVLSPSNTHSEMEQKVEAYLKYGSKLVWIFYPEKREIRVHFMQADGVRGVRPLTETDTLDAGDVLPGFSVPVRNLFPEQVKYEQPA
jgi:Uma2 family endonuclease